MPLIAIFYQAKKDESSDSDGNSENADETGEKSKKKRKKGQSQWVQDIKKDNACNEHIGQACIVLLSTGKHCQLTMVDKSLWGMMMVSILHNYYHKFTDCGYMH